MRGRRIAVATLLTLATLFTVCAALGVWVHRQALDTDHWVDTSGELLKSEPIRTALAAYLVDEVFSSADLQARLTEVLPPRLVPLAKPAAAGLEEIARRQVPRVLGSAAAVSAWENANRAAHQALLKALDGNGEAVSLNLHDLAAQVVDKAGLPSGVVDRLPPDIGELQVLPQDDIEKARKAVKAFKTLAWILVALSVLCFAAAVYLSPDRRRTLLSVGGCILFAALVVFVARRLAGNVVVDAIVQSPNGEEPARDVWQISTSLLVDVGAGLALFGLLLVAASWFSGPGRYATTSRRFVAPAFHQHPAAARAGLAVLLLLLVLWGPVPWTQRVVPMLLFAVAAFVWLEWLRSEARDGPPSASSA